MRESEARCEGETAAHGRLDIGIYGLEGGRTDVNLSRRVRVPEGRVDQSDARRYYPEDEQARFALICTAKPLSNLWLRTHASDEMRQHRRETGCPHRTDVGAGHDEAAARVLLRPQSPTPHAQTRSPPPGASPNTGEGRHQPPSCGCSARERRSTWRPA
jgi:hypothetical protein